MGVKAVHMFSLFSLMWGKKGNYREKNHCWPGLCYEWVAVTGSLLTGTNCNDILEFW